MKAYVVYDTDSCENNRTIVFAENATKARIAAMSTDCCEDAEYIHIRAYRVPAADVAPVVHGRWSLIISDFDDSALECSVCGKELRIDDDAIVSDFIYCPFCAAKNGRR